MRFHLACYAESVGSVTNEDITAAADTVIQRRNSHLILSEPFNLIAAHGKGSNFSRLRFGNIALTRFGVPHIWPLDVSATVPDDPAVYDLRSMPMELPLNEEITLEATTTAVGPQVITAALWLAKPSWNRGLPPGLARMKVRATATIGAASTTTWSDLAELTMERDLYNGVYAVVGAHVVAANAAAFRLFFPSQQPMDGRQLRPGGLIQDTASLNPWPAQSMGLGEWGRFHTFELPSLEVFGDAAGGTYEIRLDLVYLGQALSLLHA